MIGNYTGNEPKMAEQSSANEIAQAIKLLQKNLHEFSYYKHALDESAIVAITDQKGIIRHVNDNFCKISKYSKEELIGKDHRIINSGYHPKEFIRNLWATIADGRIWKGELKNKAKDGTVYWVDTTIVPFLNEQGKPYQYVAIRADITHRKAAEESLQKSLKEVSDYKYALEQSAIVAITDQKGIITYANDNFCKISKYSKEELIGQDHRIINSGHHSKDFIRQLWVTIANGKIWKGELKNKAKDGTVYWVDTTIVPFLNEQGKPYQYVAIRADITQRKEAENNLRKINEELEEKVKERTLELTAALAREKEVGELKSRFVAMASHEFRTPLTAVLSSVSLIEKYTGVDDGEKRNRHINRIKASVKNLTGILNDFLSLDKLQEGQVEIASDSFALSEFLEDCAEEMHGMLSKKQQHIEMDSPAGVLLVQDKKVLRNVMHNLLSNAIKYSDEGKTIYLQAAVNGEVVTIAVKDEGIGIPAEEQKHLFDKFFRAKNVVNIQGTGLGLNIVKKYMELLGGDITMKSTLGQGTVFTISFPKTNK